MPIFMRQPVFLRRPVPVRRAQEMRMRAGQKEAHHAMTATREHKERPDLMRAPKGKLPPLFMRM